MTQIDRLMEWFEAGRLVRPSAQTLNFVDLIRALFRLAGVPAVEGGPGVDALCGEIGTAEHYLFIVVDGLGLDSVLHLPEESFLRTHLRDRLQAVFFSTTAAAMPTLATGEWPCKHGSPGWWAYLEEFDVSAEVLPFQERESERPLTDLGVAAGDVFPIPSVWPRMKHRPLSVLPSRIAESVYTRHSTGETTRFGYTGLFDAVALVRDAITRADAPTFTYLYLPQLDSASHEKGTDHRRVYELLLTLDGIIAGLVRSLDGRARVVVTADHGQANVDSEHRFILEAHDPLAPLLRCCPTGEPTVPIFHVRPGCEARFAVEFLGRFAEHFALLEPAEIEGLGLLGPGPLSPVMKRRLGDFVGIGCRPAKFYIRPCVGSHPNYIGVHGGLTPAEMNVPLVLA